ncbi:TonB-dependent receptor [Opitutales bacterium ASA1]|nr:TonB-dependent receptor [Opitutales bacterium ASA1]
MLVAAFTTKTTRLKMNLSSTQPTHRNPGVLRLCLALLVAVFFSTGAFGQAITTSSLTGTVLGDQGQPAAGAVVKVVHEPTGAVYDTTTRADGRFALRGLRPGGPYTVTAESAGAAKVENREVYLDIDRGADLSLRLPSEQAIELDEFEVSADPLDRLFGSGRTGSGSYLSSEDIVNLPAGDRSINSLARLDPRISYNRDPFDRGISVSGLSNRFNSVQVDGVSASDPFGLNANNTAAERNAIPLDSLEALSVDTAPYSVRNAGFVGARINAVTKSGTNEFKGSLAYSYRGRSAFGGMDLVGIELDGVTRALSDFSEETYSFNLGGPIVPNKLFFYASYEKVKEDRIPPSPSVGVDPAIIAQIVTAAQALGFDPGSPTPPAANRLDDENILLKLDWNINADHRATFRYNNVESTRPTFPGFGTGNAQNNFSFDSHWYDQSVKNKSYIGQLISRWSDRLDTEVSISRSKYESQPINNSRQPRVQIRDVAVPGSNTSFINFGTEISRHANVLEVETDTIEAFASYELNDSHSLRFGLQYELADVYNLFVQNAYGSYEFANLQQFLNVAANNNGSIRYRNYTYNEIVDGVNPAAEFEEGNLGLFVEDVWRLNPTLTINAGVRLDIPRLPDDVPFNQSFTNAFGVRNDHTYDGEKVFQPRVGFNWSPALEKRTTVRGGFGLFYGRAPRVWISNSYSNTGLNFRTWSAGTNPVSGVSASDAPIVSADPDAQPTIGNAPAQQVAFINPDFQLPSRWKANIAVDRQLPFFNLKGTLEYEKTWVKRDIFYRNVNIAQTGTGPDGRALYFNTYGATAGGTRLVNTAFTNRIIELGNTDEGGTDVITVALERPRQRDGWYWRAAYVNTRADEVLFGTSSVAASNWNNRSVFNTNEAEVHRSELEVRDRVTFNITKELELKKGYRTTFSLFYEGRSGYPFSLTSNTDTNGDSVTNNDLIYVPVRGSNTARFANATDEQRFWAIVDRFGLKEGEAVEAASETYPWVNQFDFGIKQEVKLPGWRHRLVLGLDILNIGNLLNDKWGLIRGSNQFFVKRETVANVTYDGVNNQYVYSNVSAALAERAQFNPSLGRGEPAASRWSVLLSARYAF